MLSTMIPAENATASAAVPARFSVSEILSQDLVIAEGIPVDVSSPNAIAAFENIIVDSGERVDGGHAHEALIVERKENSRRRLVHVRFDPDSATGWSVTHLHQDYEPTEVAVAIDRKFDRENPDVKAITCYFVADKKLYSSALEDDGKNWEDPVLCYGGEVRPGLKSGHLSSSRELTYDRTGVGMQAGTVSVRTAGDRTDLLTYGQSRHISESVEGVVGDSEFAATAASRIYTKEEGLRIDVKAPHSPESSFWLGPKGSAKILSAFSHEKEFEGGPRDVFDFLVQESNGTVRVKSYDGGEEIEGGEEIPFPMAGVKLREVVASRAWKNGPAGPAGLMRWWKLYALDEKGTVWLIRQCNTGHAVDRVKWSPAVPVLQGVKALSASSSFTTKQAALFYAQDSDRRLRLKVQDYGEGKSGTGLWREVDVHGPSNEIFEVSRHRVEAVLFSDRDAPLANTEVALSVCAGSSACEVFYQGKAQRVAPGEPVKLCTDALGRVTISVTPNGLAVPRLELTATSKAATPVTQPLQPGLGMHTYLTGKGTLNPTNPGGGLEKFDESGTALRKLKPGLSPEHAKAAATVIRQAAAQGLALHAGKPAGNGAAWDGHTEDRPAGMWVSMSDDEPWETGVLQTEEDLAAFYADQSGQWNIFSDAWNAVQHTAGDIYQGLKDGAVQLGKAAFNFVEGTVHLVLKIGSEFIQGVKVAFKGIEEAGHFVAGVFHRIGVAIGEVIDWLKALFSFDHIWNTKMAFEKALGQVDPIISGGLTKVQSSVDTWITGQKENMAQLFEQARTELKKQGGDKKLSVLHDEAKKGSGGSDPGSTGGAQQNWLTDKVTTARPTLPDLPTPKEGQGAGHSLIDQLKTNADDIVNVASSLLDTFQDVLKDHGRLKSQSVTELLTNVEKFVIHLLDTAQKLLDAFFALLKDAVHGFADLMNTELPLGPLNTLWAWIAKAAGHPHDGKLTVASLVSLMAAVPVTLLYKLLKKDSSAQPFPPQHQDADGSGLLDLSESEQKAYRVGAALALITAIPLSILSDVLGSEAPWQFSLGMVAVSVIIFAMSHADLTWGTMKAAATKEIAPFIGIIAFAVTSVAFSFFYPLQTLWAVIKRFVPLVLSVVGCGCLAWAIYAAADKKVTDPAAITASIVGTLPLLFSFLNYDSIREPNIEYALPAKVFFTGFGNLSSGMLNVVCNWE
ncbi:hypothetical protein [Streptomyces altiplanensis]